MSRLRKPRRLTTQVLAVGLSLITARFALSAPGDVASSPAPVMGARPPKPLQVGADDARVSPQTGAMQYGYEFQLPPGRGSAAPKLSLQYSSQSGLYGGVAAGWALGDIPELSRDYSLGYHSFDRPGGVAAETPRWRSSMAGGRELVEIAEAKPSASTHTYRAQADATFTRYQQLSASPEDADRWVALAIDGSRYEFGFTGAFAGWAPLSRSQDAFGNQVTYRWEAVYEPSSEFPVDYRIDEILYGANANAGLDDHARVSFEYARDAFPCAGSPVGAELGYDGGVPRWKGASKLTAVVTWVRDQSWSPWRQVRRYELAYDAAAESCSAPHTPVRLLSSVTERDANDVQAGPPISFGYGEMGPDLSGSLQVTRHSSMAYAKSLGWGHRVAHSALRTSTLEAQLLDLDADGRPDRLFESSAQGTDRCMLSWNPNRGDRDVDFGAPALATPGGVPAIPWANGSTQGPDEECSLTGQYSLVVNIPEDQQNPSCHDRNLGHFNYYRYLDINSDGVPDLVTALHYDPGYYRPPNPPPPPGDEPETSCVDVDDDCMARAIECAPEDGTVVCEYHYDAITACVIQSSRHGCFDGGQVQVAAPATTTTTTTQRTARSRTIGGIGGGTIGGGSGDPSPPNDLCIPTRKPWTHGNQYVWFWYPGHGDGTFDVAGGQPIYAPIPLASSTGDEAAHNNQFSSASQSQIIIDLDGDGNIDVARIVINNNDELHPVWWYWRGDGSGHFHGRDADGDASTPDSPYIWTVPTGARPLSLGTPTGNGDVVNTQKAGVLDVNADGRPDFVTWSSSGLAVHYNTGTGFAQRPRYLPLSPNEISRAVTDGGVLDDSIRSAGYHTTMLRAIDADADGRLDWQYDNGRTPWLRFNQLGTLTPAHALAAAGQLTERTWIGPSGAADTWYVGNSAVDLNGDGILDVARNDTSSAATASATASRPGVLTSIDNHRGLVVDVEYRPVFGELPQPVWVVDRLTRNDTHSAAGDEVWRYDYNDAVFNQDDHGRWGFRGFGSVETLHPRGSLTIDSFDYQLDNSGRQVGAVVFPAGDTLHPHTVDITNWRRLELFAGAVRAFVPSDRIRRTCGAGQEMSACLATGARLHEAFEWAPLTSGGGAELSYAIANSTQNDERRSATEYQLLYDASRYQAAPVRERRERYDGTAWTTIGLTERTYDDGLRVALETAVWQDAQRKATTVRDYDLATGNLMSRAKPEQVAAGGSGALRESYRYDPWELFVARTTNELGHVVETDHDLASGALVSTRGPNVAAGKREEVRDVLDAQGRTIEKWVTVDNLLPDQPYLERLIERTSYYDLESPVRVRTETRIDVAGNDWTTVDRRYDGHGRLISQTTKVGGDQPNAELAYQYDTEGHLIEFRSPDPTYDDGEVSYRYSYDSVGRPTGFRLPLGSGVNAYWNGLEQTLDECVADADWNCVDNAPGSARKRVLEDVYGRLARVDELAPSGGWTTTTYDYDGNDNLALIRDAENQTTALTHDWAGHRVRIERAGQTWTYAYDLNGNMVAEVAPSPAGGDPLDYTVTRGYDELDRESSTFTGRGALATNDAAGLGVGLSLKTYDTGANGVGRLGEVTFPDGTLALSYSYDGRGNRATESVSFDLAAMGAPGFTDTREIRHSYNPQGKVLHTVHADALGSVPATETTVAYDRRGLPEKVTWGKTVLARYGRNVAGQVMTRTGPHSQRWFAYDQLGRVTHDVGMNDDGFGQHSHVLGYDPTGNLVSLSSYVPDTGTRELAFTYDRRHQLHTAADDHGYSAALGYSAVGKIMTANVVLPAGAEAAGVLTRNVNYNYANSPDRQAVDALVEAGTGTVRARYTYDASGNVIERWDADGTIGFQYDGDNQLRIATAPDGSTERYFYGTTGARTLAVQRGAGGAIERVRLWLGDSEIWYGPKATVSRTWAHVNLGTPVARIENRSILELVHHDMLGNLVVALDGDGNPTAGFQYGAFGEVLASTGDTAAHLRRFNGKEHDSISRLAYYGYRYYDELALGWTQADPLYRFAPETAYREPRRMNLYMFSLNNPLRYVDPDGRNPAVACLASPLCRTGVVVGAKAAVKYGPQLGRAAVAGAAVVAGALGLIATYEFTIDAIPEIAPMQTSRHTKPKTEPKPKGKKARDSSKNEKHGDNGRALDKAQEQIKHLEEQLKNAVRRTDKKKIDQKIKNIRRIAEKKKKGTEDTIKPKR